MAPVDTKTTKSPPVINSHFTHPTHPLHLVDIDKDFECDGCNGPGHGRRYRCSTCTFDLHERCATCPSSLSCDFHPDHSLTLVVNPAMHRPCSLCGDDVAGLYYTCSRGPTKGCTFNIHPLCTELPASVHHALHPNHLLTLQPSSSAGRCLACSGSCSDQWRYRCGTCGVDAHMECAFGQNPPTTSPQVAIGHPAVGAVSWSPQPPPPPPPTVMYYQNGCLYVVPAGVPNPCAAYNNNYKLFSQQPLYNNNSNYNYYYYSQGQTGNYNYGYHYYQPGGRQQQQQQRPQQQQQLGGCSSSTGGSGLTMKRICSLVGFIAFKLAAGAVSGAFC